MIEPITTEQQLRDAMNVQEHEHLEFKAAQNQYSKEKLFQYCVALANERGGNLVMGVTDERPREIVGTQSFPNLERIKKDILDALDFRVNIYEILIPEGRV